MEKICSSSSIRSLPEADWKEGKEGGRREINPLQGKLREERDPGWFITTRR